MKYELERRKYAQDLIDFDKKFSALFSGKPRTEENEDGVSHAEFLAAFQTFGGFTSGIGIQYLPSAITDPTHQTIAAKLVIGARMPPQTILRAADARPYELQDLLLSDTRFKILVFSGDLDAEHQRDRLSAFAREATTDGGFVHKYGWRHAGEEAEWGEVFELVTIVSGKKETVNYTAVPAVLRSHWSKYVPVPIFSFARIDCSSKSIRRRC